MHILSLTVDQAVDSAAFPIPHREVGSLGCCISVTTERLSENQSTSPTSPPSGSAARGHLPRRTMHRNHTSCIILLILIHIQHIQNSMTVKCRHTYKLYLPLHGHSNSPLSCFSKKKEGEIQKKSIIN